MRGAVRRGICAAFWMAALGAPASSQAIEDYGPWEAGWRDVQFLDQHYGRGVLEGRMYYPATAWGRDAPPAAGDGPYPLVGFLHGWWVGPEAYDLLCTHMASAGFVVAAIGTEDGFWGVMDAEAWDARAMMQWAEDQSGLAGGFFEGLVDPDRPWSAVGHSMGGGALGYLAGVEPRLHLLIAMEPYHGRYNGGSLGALPGFESHRGPAMFIGGSVDDWTPVGTMARVYYDTAALAQRNHLTVVLGAGHYAPEDYPVGALADPLPWPDQHRLHRRLVTGMLRAEILGEEDLYYELVGEGILDEPLSVEVRAHQAAFWVQESTHFSNFLVLGMTAWPGDALVFARSGVPASRNTPYGVLGLDTAALEIVTRDESPLDGVLEVLLPIQASWAGTTLWFQGLQRRGPSALLTRTVSVDFP